MREPVHPWDIVRDSQVLADDAGIAGFVQVADVGASPVRVHLVNRDREFGPCLDRGDLARGKCVFRILADVDVAGELRPAALVDNIGLDLSVPDDGGVLLAGTDRSAVPCDILIDCVYVSTGVFITSDFRVYIPWKPTLLGEVEMPWARRITPWAWATPRSAATGRAMD